MTDHITTADLATVRQALTLGLARQPLRLSPGLQALTANAGAARDPALATLALVGQRLRFERPPTPDAATVPEAATHLHQDRRPVLPTPLRRALLRLVNGADKSMAPLVAGAACRRLSAAGWRLHPFDLPSLMPHLKAQRGDLGLAERAYLALTETTETSAPASSLLHLDISRENWTAFGKGQRAAFLRQQRRSDAVAALTLLEGVFKTETAPVRVDLLAALDTGLSTADLPFLEGLVTDRADSVRTQAAALITRIPGTPTFDTRLAAAAACFAKPKGLGKLAAAIGLGNEVVFQPPKDTNHVQLRSLFAGLTAAQIGSAAGLTVAQVLEALPSQDLSMFYGFVEAARSVPPSSPGGIGDLAAYLLDPDRSAPYPAAHVLHQLVTEQLEPLSDDFARRLMASSRWLTAVQRMAELGANAAIKDDGILVLTALLLPVSQMPTFLQSTAALLVTTTRTARDFAEFTLALLATPPQQ